MVWIVERFIVSLRLLIGIVWMVCVCCSICCVTSIGAAPPLLSSIFMPKSPLGPAGLCDAVKRKQPSDCVLRIKWEAAGVQRTPFCPIMKCW